MSLYEERLHNPGVAALYLHIPFCVQKCAYCDFASRATASDDPRMGRYVDALIDQVHRYADVGLLQETCTAYIGGGTPTLLGPHLVRLVEAVREVCPGLVEFTSEANPDSLSTMLLEELADAGLTRISIGVQSTNDAELKALGRVHDAETALKRVREAVGSGLDVSCDLMCATPLQTGASWKESLRDVLACGVGHVSVYPLQIEEGTPLSREVGDSEPAWNSTDVQADRMEVAYRVLTVAGYEHYEVASYAKPGKRCHHNIAYWSGQTYLGLGTSAASMLTRGAYDTLRKVSSWLPQVPDQAFRMRLKVIDNLKPQVELEALTGPQAVAEDLMLAMRTADGVSSDQLAYAERVLGKDKIERCIAELVRRDLVLSSDSTNKGHDGLEAATGGLMAANDPIGGLKPTHQGWLLGNELYEALWDLAPDQETIVMEASA